MMLRGPQQFYIGVNQANLNPATPGGQIALAGLIDQNICEVQLNAISSSQLSFPGNSPEQLVKKITRLKMECAIQLKQAFQTNMTSLRVFIPKFSTESNEFKAMVKQSYGYTPLQRLTALVTYIPAEKLLGLTNLDGLEGQFQAFKKQTHDIRKELKEIFPTITDEHIPSMEFIISETRLLVIRFSEGYFKVNKRILRLVKDGKCTSTQAAQWQQEVIKAFLENIEKDPSYLEVGFLSIGLQIENKRIKESLEGTDVQPNMLKDLIEAAKLVKKTHLGSGPSTTPGLPQPQKEQSTAEAASPSGEITPVESTASKKKSKKKKQEQNKKSEGLSKEKSDAQTTITTQNTPAKDPISSAPSTPTGSSHPSETKSVEKPRIPTQRKDTQQLMNQIATSLRGRLSSQEVIEIQSQFNEAKKSLDGALAEEATCINEMNGMIESGRSNQDKFTKLNGHHLSIKNKINETHNRFKNLTKRLESLDKRTISSLDLSSTSTHRTTAQTRSSLFKPGRQAADEKKLEIAVENAKYPAFKQGKLKSLQSFCDFSPETKDGNDSMTIRALKMQSILFEIQECVTTLSSVSPHFRQNIKLEALSELHHALLHCVDLIPDSEDPEQLDQFNAIEKEILEFGKSMISCMNADNYLALKKCSLYEKMKPYGKKQIDTADRMRGAFRLASLETDFEFLPEELKRKLPAGMLEGAAKRIGQLKPVYTPQTAAKKQSQPTLSDKTRRMTLL